MKDPKIKGLSGKTSAFERFNIKSILNFIYGLALFSFLILFISNHIVSLGLSLSVVPQDLPLMKTFYAFVPFPIPIFILDKNQLFWYFIFILSCLSISVLWMFIKDLKKTIHTIIDAMKSGAPFEFKTKNSFILIGQLLLTYFFFYVIYWGSLELLGLYSIGEGSGKTTGYDMFILANSPVFEELLYRVLMIGLPLLVFTFLLGKVKKNRIPVYRYIFGGKIKLDFLALLFLLLSSIVFATAHIYSFGSYYIFPPIFLAGFLFGHLFLKKGLYAAIILHFCITYMDMLISASNSGYVPIALLPFISISIIAKYILIASGVVIGPVLFFYYGKSAISYIKGIVMGHI
jgi:membrane protease YdiL (CAAX protease family)